MATDLNDIEQICQLKARYFRAMDQKDWIAYLGVFAEDAVIDTTDDTGPDTCRPAHSGRSPSHFPEPSGWTGVVDSRLPDDLVVQRACPSGSEWAPA